MQTNPFGTNTVIVKRTFGNGVTRFVRVMDCGYEDRTEWWTFDMHPSLDEAQALSAGVPVLDHEEFCRRANINPRED